MERLTYFLSLSVSLVCSEVCKRAYYESACGEGTKTTCACVEYVPRALPEALPFTLRWYSKPEQIIPEDYR